MEDEFDLDSDDELQIDERLGKEKATLIIRPSVYLFFLVPSLPISHFVSGTLDRPKALGLSLLTF